MLESILVVLHILVCFFLIFVVLLQSGQAADLAGAFGGGGSQTALGMRGAATLLQKLTTVSAIVFMLTSLALGIVGRFESSSVIDDLEVPAATVPTPSTEAATPTTVPTPTTTPTPGDGGSGQQNGQGDGQDAGQGGR